MFCLTLDTALETSIALVQKGVQLSSVSEGGPRRHAEDLGTQVTQAVREAGYGDTPLGSLGLDAVCVGRGPGSFTAVRAGLAFARGLGRGLGIPVFGIPSFAGYALNALAANPNLEEVTVVTDARRREVFWGAYTLDSLGQVEPSIPLAVGPFSEVTVRGALVFDPKLELPGNLVAKEVLRVDPNSAALARLLEEAQQTAEGNAAVTLLDPIYLRRPDVSPPK